MTVTSFLYYNLVYRKKKNTRSCLKLSFPVEEKYVTLLYIFSHLDLIWAWHDIVAILSSELWFIFVLDYNHSTIK